MKPSQQAKTGVTLLNWVIRFWKSKEEKIVDRWRIGFSWSLRNFHTIISTCRRLRLCIDRTPKQSDTTEQLSTAQHTEELRTPRNKGWITSLAKKLNK